MAMPEQGNLTCGTFPEALHGGAFWASTLLTMWFRFEAPGPAMPPWTATAADSGRRSTGAADSRLSSTADSGRRSTGASNGRGSSTTDGGRRSTEG